METFVTSEDLKISSPSTIAILGPSQSGKTSWVVESILDEGNVFKAPAPSLYMLVYADWQPLYDVLRGYLGDRLYAVKGWRENLLEETGILCRSSKTPLCLIIDDQNIRLFASKKSRETVAELVEIHTHHCNLIVMYISQSLVLDGGGSATIQRLLLRNSSYVVLFNSPIYQEAVKRLSTSLTGQANALTNALEDVMRTVGQNYIVLDLCISRDPESYATRKLVKIRSGTWGGAVARRERPLFLYAAQH